MIRFEEQKNLFLISNDSLLLVLYITSTKQVECIYFGKKIKLEEALKQRKSYKDNWSTSYFDNKLHKEIDLDDGYSLEVSKCEIGAHGLCDHRPAPIIIKKADGNVETNFIYDGYKVNKGYPSYKTGPHAHDGDVETLKLFLHDELNENIKLIYNLSIDLDKDIILKNFEIINEGNESVEIKRALSMQLDLDTNEYTVHHFGGKWGNERNEFVNHVIDGEQIISSNYGRSSHEENPFFYLSKIDATQDYGEVIGFNLVYSGNFKASIFSNFNKATRVTYGINDYNFAWVLSSKETFITPQAVISYSFEGVNKMSQNFHSFIKENIITYKKENEYKSIIFNSWEGLEMNFNTERILSCIDAAKTIGSELFVLDDGWFSIREKDETGLGDWWINKDKIDLANVIDYCHEKGMKFGLWIEPEMVSPGTELLKNHPDYAIGYSRQKQSIHRHQFLLDFTRKEVVDNLYSQLIEIIDNHKIDYIKWDHNRDLKESYFPHLGPNRQGEATHRLTLGFYDLIERLTSRYPDILFEGCASGGGRYDLGALYYTPQIWCSDNATPKARRFIQYNTSIGYPLSTMGSHVNKSDEASYEVKGYLSLFGTFGYEMDPNTLNNDEINELNEVAKIYKEYHKSLFEDGVLYHLSSPHFYNLMKMEVVSKDQKLAALIMMNEREIKDFSEFIKFKGLNPNAVYSVQFEDIKIEEKGEILMSKGIDGSLFKKTFKECDALLLILKEKVK